MRRVELVLRGLSFGAIVAGFISAFVLYAVNYDTRGKESGAHKLAQKIEKARRDIAVLKAERALLASPARLEAHARKLGLAPATGEQFQALSSIEDR